MEFDTRRQKIRKLYNDAEIVYDAAREVYDNYLTIIDEKRKLNIPIHSWKSSFTYTSDWVILSDFSHQWTLEFAQFPISFLPFVRYAVINKNINMDAFYVNTVHFNQIQDTDIESIKKVRMIFGVNIHPRMTWVYEGRSGTPMGNMESLLGTFPTYISDELMGTESSITDFQSKLIVRIVNTEVYR